MAIDQNTLSELLSYLEETISILEQRKISLPALKDSVGLADSTKYRIQTAVEAVINISEHLVSGLNLAHPNRAKDTLPALVKGGIISQDLAEKLGKAFDMRNILVHLYTEVELEEIADAATSGMDDLREFTRQINSFLDKNKD